MKIISPTSSGGRLIQGDKPWGKFRICLEPAAADKPLSIVDGDGHIVGTATITPRDPRVLSPEQRQLAVDRAAVCGRGCRFNRGLTDLKVKCDLCGCGGLSLVHGDCPAGKW